jgi:dienelactone hydrolase
LTTNIQLQGYCAYDDAHDDKKPVVLVFHDWSGRNEFACQKADQLAQLGYVGFAVDMYGDGKTANTKEEKTALMKPLLEDRNKLKNRILAALATGKTIEAVDVKRIGAIGFCFGGLCALDLARSGADIQGVVSFHGQLLAPEKRPTPPITAKILVLHGYNDPMVPPDQVMTFANEMTTAKTDWQIDMYGNTMHGFTNPKANDTSSGIVYNETSAMRSWLAMQHFFEEIF